MSDSVWKMPFAGMSVAVLADCHIHDGGPQFPPALFERLRGADLIVTLGDMVGLAACADPFEEASEGAAASRRLFDCVPDVLLFAGTHKVAAEQFGSAGMALNPGSAVLPAEGSAASFLRLHVLDGGKGFAYETETL